MRIHRLRRAFTLIELLVVIALISLLMAVLVPVVLTFMSGRGLRMAGNNVQGFFAFCRSEALNTRMPHIIVAYTEEKQLSLPGGTTRAIGPGFAVFRVNNAAATVDNAVEFVKEFRFDALGDDVEFAKYWATHVYKAPMTDLGRYEGEANDRFKDFYHIVMRVDGRAQIPGDRPGYMIDQDKPERMIADLILQDSNRFLFIDINPATGAVRSSEPYIKKETGYPEG